MILCTYHDFPGIRQELQYLLAQEGKRTFVGEWQSIKDADAVQSHTIELQNVVFEMEIPSSRRDLERETGCNMPFAEAQFQDRVSGKPLNPPPSDRLWPWAHHLEDDKAEGQYSHTYPERFWPKYAGGNERGRGAHGLRGIRFNYGDLGDVVSQLAGSPGTRQAYLPVWFPEDTGAVHGERVPCSLGYHFLLREGRLHCTYFIRSVDFFRHFPDDVYMACRLVQWMCEQLWKSDSPYQFDTLQPGNLVMHICNLHVFAAERSRLMRG